MLSLAFYLIKHNIRPPERFLQALPFPDPGNADGNTGENSFSLPDTMIRLPQNLFSHGTSIRIGSQICTEQGKLISACSAGHTAGSCRLPDQPAHFLQNRIPLLVAVGIIDLLEIIQIKVIQ